MDALTFNAGAMSRPAKDAPGRALISLEGLTTVFVAKGTWWALRWQFPTRPPLVTNVQSAERPGGGVEWQLEWLEL